ncbi:MAG: hypothetical protein K2J42_07110 [Muribaculaceae bacterium]|nr:hypothetical protein [Muribaculaceae bacterium]
MTVKELFQPLDFKEIIEPLVLKYPKALKPMSEYKENYDIILNTEFSGEGGTITFHPNGDSDAYMIEGDRYLNIVGMEVILPANGEVSKAEAAAEILWCAAPFGRHPVVDWSVFEEDVAESCALQAKRLDIKMALPYCRDKEILRVLKREMQSPSEDLCLSAEANDWFVFGKGKLWGNRQNRSKRKRLYRMKKRSAELYLSSEIHKELDLLEAKIGYVSENIRQLALYSSSIDKAYYKSQTAGKTDRIAYLEDLLLNPLYNSKKFLSHDKNQECICVLYTTPECPCTSDEQNRITDILRKYFGSTPWQLFTRQCNFIDCEVELNITYITQ